MGEFVKGPKLLGAVALVPPKSDIKEAAMRTADYHSLVEGFEIALSHQTNQLPEPFKGQQVVQLDFATEVPWVLAEQEPAS